MFNLQKSVTSLIRFVINYIKNKNKYYKSRTTMRAIAMVVIVNPKIHHIALNGLHHLRTPSHNNHVTPLDLPLEPHTSKISQG